MVHPSKLRALARRGPDIVKWLRAWEELLQEEMRKQGFDPHPHAVDPDDSMTMALERGKVRALVRGMKEWRAEIQRFSN
jgi:hypothetical protein